MLSLLLIWTIAATILEQLPLFELVDDLIG